MNGREVAWRVFSAEFNSSSLESQGEGEYAPSYLITPLGAKLNRVFVVGVITEIENIGTEEEPMYRARLSDPTGVFYLSAGVYQPEASHALSKLRPPVFAAVAGKCRTYSPEEGVVYVSVRPEFVKEVDADLRDYWILETCRSMKMRLDAAREALNMSPPTTEELIAPGYPPNLADGVVLALDYYEDLDIERYENLLVDALKYIIPEYQSADGHLDTGKVGAEWTPSVKDVPDVHGAEREEDTESQELDEKVLDIIKSLDSGKGAAWDEIVSAAKKAGIEREKLEEITNSLLDKGLLFEPVLGKMKRI